MLSRRAQPFVFTLLFTGALALVISLASTLDVYRLNAGFIARWMRAFLLAWLVALPFGLLLLGPIKRAAESMCK